MRHPGTVDLDTRDDHALLSTIKALVQEKTRVLEPTPAAGKAERWGDELATSILKEFEKERALTLALEDLVSQQGGALKVAAFGQDFLLELRPARSADDADEDEDGPFLPEVRALERRLLARGLREQGRILRQSEMLTLEQAHELTGMSVRTLTDWRVKGRLLGLSRTGAQKGFRFPEWQFDERVLEAMPVILEAFGLSREWQAYDFLTLPEPLLGGRIPLEELRAGRRADVEKVLPAAASLEQGSS